MLEKQLTLLAETFGAAGWGIFELLTDSDQFNFQLRITSGSAYLQSISLLVKFEMVSASISYGDRTINCSVQADPARPGIIHATLEQSITLAPGSQLVIRASPINNPARPKISLSRKIVRQIKAGNPVVP